MSSTLSERLIDAELRTTLADLMASGVAAPDGDAADTGSPPLVVCAEALQRAGVTGTRPVCAFMVPGRIEVLGKHTDYGGGRSLLAAVERGFRVVASPRDDDAVVIIDLGSRQHARFALAPELEPLPGGWRTYPMTVARRIAQNFPRARTGADIAFLSDLPRAAGLSSSSALVIGVFLALATVNRIGEERAYREMIGGLDDLGDYLGAIENGLDYRGLEGDRGVGTRGGSQDQTAILSSRPGRLIQIAFGPVRFEGEIRIPTGYTFAIASSGIHAAKIGAARGAYNRAAAEMARLIEIWSEGMGRSDPYLGAALEGVDDGVSQLHSLIAALPAEGSLTGSSLTERDRLARRLDQFAGEALEIVPGAARALAAGDLDTFGKLVDQSQGLAERGLGNQIEETIFLQRSARREGAAAASAFGAGYGGSVWALVRTDQADHFIDRWRRAYADRYPEVAARAEFFNSGAGPGARRIA